MKTSEEIQQLLDESIPLDAISQRKQGNIKLSYVEGWWVKAELNRIFGWDGWFDEVQHLEQVYLAKHRLKEDGDEAWCCTYTCTLQITITGKGGTTHSGDGCGHGVSYRPHPGDAIESARKEAVTDALKRAAHPFGWRLGLALYDKSREHVGSSEPVRLQPGDSRVEKPSLNRGMAREKLRGLIDRYNAIATRKAMAKEKMPEISSMSDQEIMTWGKDLLDRVRYLEIQNEKPKQEEIPDNIPF